MSVSVLSSASSAAIAIVAGLRLLWLARSTRQLPEATWGVAWLLFGASAIMEQVVLASGLSDVVYFVYLLFGFSIALTLAVANRVTFRPTAPWAVGIIAGLLLSDLASLAYQGTTLGFDLTNMGLEGRDLEHWNTYPQWTMRGTVLVSLFWLVAESLLQRQNEQRRMRLGLSSPLRATRFSLMAIAASAFFVYMGSSVLYGLGFSFSAHKYLMPLASLIGAICVWLAFFPPKAWGTQT
ncbi:MAG: hypothetical protein AAFU77_06615 [Myxococcota bacterium]